MERGAERRLFQPERAAEKLAGVACFAGGDLFRRAGRDDPAARIPALGAKVDEIIRALDNIEIVLDHEHGTAAVA